MPRSRSRVSQIAKTGSSGDYILRALWPSTYLVKVTAPGFQTVEQKGVVLAFDQVTTLNFTLRPAGTFTMIQVTEAAPLLNRDFFGLVFLNAGVSEAAGSGTTDNYPAGTDTTVEQLLANSHFHMLPVGLCAKSVPSWVKTLSCPRFPFAPPMANMECQSHRRAGLCRDSAGNRSYKQPRRTRELPITRAGHTIHPEWRMISDLLTFSLSVCQALFLSCSSISLYITWPS